MQKHWYIVYTRPRLEKKVASHLTKRKIENFLPINSKKFVSSKKTKYLQEPLFESYVFVRTTESEWARVRSVEGVVNFVYWKGKPANMSDDEIEIMREFTSNHTNIRIEKIQVNERSHESVFEGSKFLRSGTLLSIKNTFAKANLPSIGFALMADVVSESRLELESSFHEKALFLQS